MRTDSELVGRFAVRLFLALFSFLFLSCSSVQEPRAQQSTPSIASLSTYDLSRVVNEKMVSAHLDANTETLLQEAQTFSKTAKSRGFEAAKAQACEQNTNSAFCLMAIDNGGESEKREKAKRLPKAQVREWIKKENITELSKASLNDMVAALKGMAKSKIQSLGDKAIAAETCPGSGMLTALGSKAEDDFPEMEWVERSTKLYERAAICANDEASMRARYRLAMISIWKGDCPRAIPHLESLKKDASVSFLHTRANYWQTHCETKAGLKKPEQLKAQAETNLKESPLSFHTLISFAANENEPFKIAQSRKEPFVLFRSSKDLGLNSKIEATELLLLIGDRENAKRCLKMVKPEALDATELEFQLYVATLYNQLDDGLSKFRVLSRVFSLDPSLKTQSGLKLFYPNWYFDLVRDTANGNDPVLILSLIRQESAFNERATSRAGARGLMQLMPRTARALARVNRNDLYKPDINVKLGNKFFGQLLKRFDGQVNLALAAYNAGPLQVDEWRKRYPTDNQLLFMDMIPFRETREYVAIILRNYYWYTRLYPEFGREPASPLQATRIDKIEAPAPSPTN